MVDITWSQWACGLKDSYSLVLDEADATIIGMKHGSYMVVYVRFASSYLHLQVLVPVQIKHLWLKNPDISQD